MDSWVPIFKSGKQTDSQGREHDGTAMIDKAVANFDAKNHEPPVTIGHPKDNAPAFGWVEDLKKQGDFLMAKFKDLQPEFVDMVKRGLFKKRSASFYPDGSLRHVGFLGAAPPAVKGLPDVAFQGSDQMTFEFSAHDSHKFGVLGRVLRSMREFLIAKFDEETANKVVDNSDIDFLIQPADPELPEPETDFMDRTDDFGKLLTRRISALENDKTSRADIVNKMASEAGIEASTVNQILNGSISCPPINRLEGIAKALGVSSSSVIDAATRSGCKYESKFQEGKMSATFTEEDLLREREKGVKDGRKDVASEFADKEKESDKRISDLKVENKKLKKKGRHDSVKSFTEGLKKEGKYLPAWDKLGLPEFMESLVSDDPVEFSEGKKQTPLEFMEGFLSELSKTVNFNEVSGGNGPSATDEAEPLIQDFMEKNKVDYKTAAVEISKKRPELFK